jgi:phage-related protein
LVDQIDPEETAASRISKVRVRFDIGDPFEYAVNKTRVSQAISGTTTFTVTNAGTAMVFPIISLTNSSSAITSLTIENLTTGQKVSYSGTLSTSDVLKIDTENLTVENDGVNDLGNVTNEIGVQLAPGGNEIRVTGMAAGTAIVDFRNRWY